MERKACPEDDTSHCKIAPSGFWRGLPCSLVYKGSADNYLSLGTEFFDSQCEARRISSSLIDHGRENTQF